MRQNSPVIITILTGVIAIMWWLNYNLEIRCEKFENELNRMSGHSLENDSVLGEYQMALSTFLDSDSACAQKFIKIIEDINIGQ